MRFLYGIFFAIWSIQFLATTLVAVDYPPLNEVSFDTVWLPGGRPIHGIITEEKADGTIVIKDNGLEQKFSRGGYEKIDRRISINELIVKRGTAIIAARDWDELVRTVHWAVEHKEQKEALTLAQKALASEPTQSKIAELLLGLMDQATQTVKPLTEVPGDSVKPEVTPEVSPSGEEQTARAAQDKQAELIIRTVLKADIRWRVGRRKLIQLLSQTGRDADLEKELHEWLVVAPTDAEPLQKMIGLKIKKGDIRGAMNLQRRLWESSSDAQEGVSYSYLLLRCGDAPRSLDVANKIIAKDAANVTAKAVAGSAYLALGKTAEAEPLLRAAVGGTLNPEWHEIAQYNLGLVCFRLGNVTEARAVWSTLSVPVAHYALAILDRQPIIKNDEFLPLSMQVDVHNTILDNANHLAQMTISDDVQNASIPQLRLLLAVRDIVKSSASIESMKPLSGIPGASARRWQAYAHMTAKRYDEALTVLDQLPSNDGYALAYRLYIALEQKDFVKANDIWQQLQSSVSPPRDWMALMQLVFDAARSDNLNERFDLEGATPPSGWVYSAIGTGIREYQQGGKLWMDGKQRLAMDAVTRAWRLVREDRLKRVVAELDIAQAKSAITGIEIMDSSRRTGVALGIKEDRSVVWRQLHMVGGWSEWATTKIKVNEGIISLGLDYSKGKVTAFQVDAPDQQEPLGNWDGQLAKQDELSVSLFGTAAEGVEWKSGIDNIRIELMSKARKGDRE